MSGRCDEQDDLTVAYLWGKADANDQIKRLTLMVESRDLVIKTERAKNERLREALRPFAKLNLFPDDLGFELSEDIKADEDWCDDANDAHVDDQWIKRGDIRAARAALGEEK